MKCLVVGAASLLALWIVWQLSRVMMHVANSLASGWFWPITIVGIVCVAIGSLVASYRLRRRTRAAVRDADIIARADLQHAAIMRGDTHVGVYGNYPPAVREKY